MIVKGWPLKFRGTIKGMKPGTAKKLFNFDLPEDAKGVTFSQRDKKTIIKAYYPEHYKSKSASSEKTNEYMKIINKIGHTHLNDIIRPIWDEPAKKKKFYSGFNYFASTNLKLIREGVEKMIISTGELEPPEIKEVKRDNEAVRMKINNQDTRNKIQTMANNQNPNNQPGQTDLQQSPQAEPELGVLVLNPRNFWFKHIAPRVYGEEVYLRVKSEEAVLFLYHKLGDKYSKSVAVRVRNEQQEIATKTLRHKSGSGDPSHDKEIRIQKRIHDKIATDCTEKTVIGLGFPAELDNLE